MTFLKRLNHLEFIISLTLDSGEIEKSREFLIPDIGFDKNTKGDLVLFRGDTNTKDTNTKIQKIQIQKIQIQKETLYCSDRFRWPIPDQSHTAELWIQARDN